MQTLDQLYVNPEITDNQLIIRCLNTIHEEFESKDYDKSCESSFMHDKMLEYGVLFMQIMRNCGHQRPAIIYILDTTYNYTNNLSFSNYMHILEENLKHDLDDYKYLWMRCYLRAVFDIAYSKNIRYKDAKYAMQQATGVDYWNIFLQSIPSNEYIYSN